MLRLRRYRNSFFSACLTERWRAGGLGVGGYLKYLVDGYCRPWERIRPLTFESQLFLSSDCRHRASARCLFRLAPPRDSRHATPPMPAPFIPRNCPCSAGQCLRDGAQMPSFCQREHSYMVVQIRIPARSQDVPPHASPMMPCRPNSPSS